jgi:hypothetical protein
LLGRERAVVRVGVGLDPEDRAVGGVAWCLRHAGGSSAGYLQGEGKGEEHGGGRERREEKGERRKSETGDWSSSQQSRQACERQGAP